MAAGGAAGGKGSTNWIFGPCPCLCFRDPRRCTAHRVTRSRGEASRLTIPTAHSCVAGSRCYCHTCRIESNTGQNAPTEDQSGNSRRIESATSHAPLRFLVSRSNARLCPQERSSGPCSNARRANPTRCGSATSMSQTFSVSAPACPITVSRFRR